ncbi:MAG TPA: helix-turn-helix domain-containing protein, partial [Phycisphaerae bacterium]|nr:helix-turn-helix domain-containing protein [Phycisphaerae bacterium]
MSDGGTRPIWIDAMLSLRGEGYRVWSYLYWRQGSNGYAWPSQEGIAEDLGLSVRYIKRVLKELEAGGWLAVEWPCGPGRGQAHTKRYTV